MHFEVTTGGALSSDRRHVGRVHSAANDLEAFANGIATLVEHLVRKRGYTCIKWLSVINEPGSNFSWWQTPPNRPEPIKPALAAVRKALDARGLNIPLSGPDAMYGFPATIPGMHNCLSLLDAYDFHDYAVDFDFRCKGRLAKQVSNARLWIQQARNEKKPVFVTEFGSMSYGWKPDKEGPNSPPAVLAASEYIIRLANAGVDGFNRWSFLNRGDLDGQWQFVDTWDRKEKKLLAEYAPHHNSYFGLGLLSRFTAKNSTVLASTVSPVMVDGFQRVFCAGFRSPKGNITIAIINDAPTDMPLKLTVSGKSGNDPIWRYRYSKAEYNRIDVQVDPQPVAGTDAWADTLPGGSLTVYSTYKLDHTMPGVIAEVEKK